jgi:hypothetical protein
VPRDIDPERVKRVVNAEGSDSNLNILKQIWPELYDAIAGQGDGRGLRCAFTSMHDAGDLEGWPLAVGRVPLNGRPACQSCVNAFLTRYELRQIPQGYPLEGVEHPTRWRQANGLVGYERRKGM